MTRFAAVLGLALGVGIACPHAALAQDSVAVAHPWFEEITVNGFVSSWYSYNLNRPPGGLNAFRVFDVDDNTFQIGVAELVAQHAVSKPGNAGFRVDLAMGSSIPKVSAASGLFRDPVTGVAQDIDLQQAFASYVAPVGSGLRLGAGKFVTHCGIEVIEGYDGWNDQATRSFLFGYAIPFTHTGIRADYAFGTKIAATAMLVNGWDDAKDNNRAKTGGVQLALTPSPALALRIGSLAERMISMAPPSTTAPVGIDVIGLRPGEKMHEHLTTQGLEMQPTSHPRIWSARQAEAGVAALPGAVRALRRAVAAGNGVAVLATLQAVVGFEASSEAWAAARRRYVRDEPRSLRASA